MARSLVLCGQKNETVVYQQQTESMCKKSQELQKQERCLCDSFSVNRAFEISLYYYSYWTKVLKTVTTK